MSVKEEANRCRMVAVLVWQSLACKDQTSKPGVVVAHSFNPNIWELDTEGLVVQSHLGYIASSEANLGSPHTSSFPKKVKK